MYYALEQALTWSIMSNINHAPGSYGRSTYTYQSNFRYRKKVKHEDQLVPIFSCVPRLKSSKLSNLPISGRSSDLFSKGFSPNLHIFLEKHPHWLTNLFILRFQTTQHQQGRGGDFISFITACRAQTNNPLLPPRSSEEFLINVLQRLGRGVCTNQLAWASDAVEVFKRDLELFRESFVTSLKNYLPYSTMEKDDQIFEEFEYGLTGPNVLSITAIGPGGSNNESMVERTLGTSSTRQLQRGFAAYTGSNTEFVSRYGYLGVSCSGVTDDEQGIFPLIQRYSQAFPRHAGYQFVPMNGLMHGVKSCFCLMVAASERKAIMEACLLGTLEELSLRPGSVELWMQEDIEKLLSKHEYMKFKELYYSVVRNKYKSPVRVFGNLTQQLFDLDTKPVDMNTFDVEANTRIKSSWLVLHRMLTQQERVSSRLIDAHHTY